METEKETLEATMVELGIFLNSADRYQKRYPKERSKLTLLLIKQAGRYTKKYAEAMGENEDELSSIRVKNASVDDKGNIIEQKFDVKQNRGDDNTVLRMAYKPEAQLKMDKDIREHNKKFNEKKIEIRPPYANEPFFLPIPDGFDFSFLEAFKKFVFNPELTEEDEERAYFVGQDQKEQKPTVQSVLN